MSQPGARAQVFNAPTPLRDRIGSRFAKIDPAALAKAEAALQGLSNNFGRWLEDEIGKLEASREAIRREGASVATMDALFTHAHDLKGLGSTYGFPIITRIAGSLCRLLGDGDTRAKTPLALVDAHIHTIRAAVRDDIRDADGPVGRALAEELERQTRGNLAEG